ncbi:hypothetical protein [Tunturiibacter gelidiferens]|uniref:hypothetical protein n=1 Tax=Tunturiibacter gelidiferens TaxID=3069689 RepID=UPI003D9ACFB0
MSHTAIDIIVVLFLFVTGIVWTVFRLGTRDRLAFAIVAVLSPVLAVLSVFSLLFKVITGKVTVGPCPAGLNEAEKLVHAERKRLFGGELREPSLARSWQSAYELELQREAESVQRITDRMFVNA